MISRCNIYLGISVVEDSQKNVVDIVFPINKIYSGKQRVSPDFKKLHQKFIYNNASGNFITLSDLGSLLQWRNNHRSGIFTPSVGFEKNFEKIFFSIGRNCLPEAKLREYVVHMIDNPLKKIKKFKGGLFEKIHYQHFQQNRRNFLNFDNFDIFLVSFDRASSHKRKTNRPVKLASGNHIFRKNSKVQFYYWEWL